MPCVTDVIVSKFHFFFIIVICAFIKKVISLYIGRSLYYQMKFGFVWTRLALLTGGHCVTIAETTQTFTNDNIGRKHYALDNFYA